MLIVIIDMCAGDAEAVPVVPFEFDQFQPDFSV